MPTRKKKPDHIAQENGDAVDSPPLTETMLKNLRPARDSMPPQLYEKLVRAQKEREAKEAAVREDVTLSLDRDVVQHFKAEGGDWRARMSAALRESRHECPVAGEDQA
jgi:uncharacterized protein (DUF4415 family)